MKPMGRKHYKDKTGGKHHSKKNGKTSCWWENICSPSKSRERRDAKKEIILICTGNNKELMK